MKKPCWKSSDGEIYHGNVIDVLKELPDESIHMCVTSPPYWGLRDYDLEPQIWDSEPSERCEGGRDHVWGDELPAAKESHTNEDFAEYNKEHYRGGGHKATEQAQNRPDNSGQFCQNCQAWRGSLGLEPTPELFIKHMVQIFAEVKRVLRKDGTLWLNMGDSYGTGTIAKRQKGSRGIGDNTQNAQDISRPGGMAKQLMGIPWKLAFALQADGWYLRSDIIWHKPNPMPESVTDRPTKSHEYLFLLTKSPKYFYDADAVKEKSSPNTNNQMSKAKTQRIREQRSAGANTRIGKGSTPKSIKPDGMIKQNDSFTNAVCLPVSNRNKRTVWTIPTQPMPDAHFATFPKKLIEPCILAGTSEKGCCVECGAPWERVVEKSKIYHRKLGYKANSAMAKNKDRKTNFYPDYYNSESKTTGWQPGCNCVGANHYDDEQRNKRVFHADMVQCIVLDPFFGSGTTALVSYKHGRKFIGIELSKTYLDDIAIPRIVGMRKQMRLFA